MTTDEIRTRPDFIVMDAGPERVFRVGLPSGPDPSAAPAAPVPDGASAAGNVATPTVTIPMLTGPWLNGPAGVAPGGTLGVLIDGVTAYAALLGRPANAWSVSAEISLDLCGPMPADGSILTADARLVGADATGALGTATVTDASGRVIALGRQHTRWIPAPDITPWAARKQVPTRLAETDGPADLVTLIGARVQAADGGAVAQVPVTRDLTNPLGNMHGGVIFAAVDLTAQAALASVGAPVQTASVRVAYVRPLPLNGAARFEARVIHRGRSFGVAEVSCVNEANKPTVIATVTTTRG
jgi:uncharacterized protein (TIGR00369 family)